MNMKSFVLALGVLLVSGTGLYAQNKGKNVAKGVEAAVSKRVPGNAGRSAGTARGISRTVPGVASGVTGRAVTGASRGAVAETPAARLLQKNPSALRPTVSRSALPDAPRPVLPDAPVAAAEVKETVEFVPVQQFAVNFLAEQAEKQRLKVREESKKVRLKDARDAGTEELNMETPQLGQEEYEVYRQAVRDALQVRKERVEKFGGEDGFHAYREKTYHSVLELAEDVALFSSVVPEVSVPPCFMDMIGGRISYVIEIPTAGVVIEKDGVREVLDPQTQVILFQPNPIAQGGKGAYITQRSSLEDPSMYVWLSGGRPEEKFAVEKDIPAGAGLSEAEWQSMKTRLRR